MKFIIMDRGMGRTAQLIDWVKEGHGTDLWPYWTRVIVTNDMEDADRLRSLLRADIDKDTEDSGRLQTVAYHQVFSLEEWQEQSVGNQKADIEVAIHNADIILLHLLGPFANLSIVVASGEVE